MAHEHTAPAPRFLIARFSALGDIVALQPVLTALRTRYGAEAVVDLVCLERCRPAAELLDGLDELHVVQRGTGEVLPALRARKFDYVLDFHGTVRSRSLARSLDVLTLKVDKQAWARWTLIRGWRSRPVRGFVDRCFDVLRPFGVVPPPPEARGEEAWGALRVPDLPAAALRTVVISLASSHPGKHLSDAVIEAAVQAAIQHGCEAILAGGEAERSRAEEFARAHAHVTSLAGGSTTLADTASALRFADAVVTGDTVTMHIAAATGTPVAAVWGCTRPTLGLAAFRPHAASVNILPEVSDPHRPCSKHGATCRHTRSQDAGHPDRCSQRVNPSLVAGWLDRVLSRTAP